MDVIYFNCPKCGRQIPTENRTIHELRCKGNDNLQHVPEQSSPADVVDSAPDETSLNNSQDNSIDNISADVEMDLDNEGKNENLETNNFWRCPTCTFAENTHDNLACDMCGTVNAEFVSSPHRPNLPPLQSVSSSIRNNFIDMSTSPAVSFDRNQHQQIPSEAHSQQSSSTASTADPSKWPCQRCTYVNNITENTCQMCGDTRPAQASYSEQLISDDDMGGHFMDFDHDHDHTERGYFPPSSYYDHNSQQFPSDSSGSSGAQSSSFNGMLLGAGAGAAMAWLNNRPITEGVVAGAGMGLLGSMLFDQSSSGATGGTSSSSSSSLPIRRQQQQCRQDATDCGQNQRSTSSYNTLRSRNANTNNTNNNASGGTTINTNSNTRQSAFDDSHINYNDFIVIDDDDEDTDNLILPAINNGASMAASHSRSYSDSSNSHSNNHSANNRNTINNAHPLEEIFQMHSNTLRERQQAEERQQRQQSHNRSFRQTLHPNETLFPEMFNSAAFNRQRQHGWGLDDDDDEDWLPAGGGGGPPGGIEQLLPLLLAQQAGMSSRRRANPGGMGGNNGGTRVYFSRSGGRGPMRTRNGYYGGAEMHPLFEQILAARSGMGGLDVDGMSYEQLLERFQAPVQRVDEGGIEALPTRTFTKHQSSDASSGTSGSASSAALAGRNAGSAIDLTTSPRNTPVKTATSSSSSSSSVAATLTAATDDSRAVEDCAICLEPYVEGDEIKTLPCLHSYHSKCIAQWLRQSRVCPVCKHSIVG